MKFSCEIQKLILYLIFGNILWSIFVSPELAATFARDKKKNIQPLTLNERQINTQEKNLAPPQAIASNLK